MKPFYFLFLFLMACGDSMLTVTSPAFNENELIPAKFTCVGEDINPEISVSGIPQEAKSLALIMDDPDAPSGDFVHWVMWNIPTDGKISENSAPGEQGLNGMDENKYKGPCPPSGTHHYHFKVYALDTKLELPAETDKQGLLKAMEGHVLVLGELVGLFKK